MFASKSESDEAHSLMQKNLKNLYDLFVMMKGQIAGIDDPMFTAKSLIQCASCSKGVKNMSGYRAEHVNWDSFPFKDPGKLKSGMGFAKLFDDSKQAFYDNQDSQVDDAATLMDSAKVKHSRRIERTSSVSGEL